MSQERINQSLEEKLRYLSPIYTNGDKLMRERGIKFLEWAGDSFREGFPDGEDSGENLPILVEKRESSS